MSETEIEQHDIVDENDEPISTTTMEEYNAAAVKPGFLRAVELLLVNSKGELWIPRRTSQKRIFPDALDYSCGGHVSAGETYVQACVRETAEELNLDLSPDYLEFIASFRPVEGRPYFRELFVYPTDETPGFNPDDFVGGEWMTPEALKARLEAGEKAKDSLLPTLNLYIEFLKNHDRTV